MYEETASREMSVLLLKRKRLRPGRSPHPSGQTDTGSRVVGIEMRNPFVQRYQLHHYAGPQPYGYQYLPGLRVLVGRSASFADTAAGNPRRGLRTRLIAAGKEQI
jgi:hypothetical protein